MAFLHDRSKVLQHTTQPSRSTLCPRHHPDQVPGSVTTTYDGIGHGRYLNAGDPCVIGHVDRYLNDGKVPAPGTTCPVRPA
ncbi:alpha/beta hydrolase [Nonomuraea sp. NPDC049421]|uniref:alpha/beta hydrolase n=1 Tax=Nonomuraea sp. NPDC049421 TaxID=3155275 RepID=UPI0034322B6C